MPEKKKDERRTQDFLPGRNSSIEDDQDDYREEQEDYFVRGGKKIQKMKRHDKKDRKKDWD